jgi:hypothetical protein
MRVVLCRRSRLAMSLDSNSGLVLGLLMFAASREGSRRGLYTLPTSSALSGDRMTLTPITIGHTHRTIRNATNDTVTTSSTYERHRCMHRDQPEPMQPAERSRLFPSTETWYRPVKPASHAPFFPMFTPGPSDSRSASPGFFFAFLLACPSGVIVVERQAVLSRMHPPHTQTCLARANTSPLPALHWHLKLRCAEQHKSCS